MKCALLLILFTALLTACEIAETSPSTATAPASLVPTLTPPSPPTLTPPPPPTLTAPPPTLTPTATPLPPIPILERTGQTGGASRAVVVQGQHAYLNVGPRLVILDVSDPALPTLVSQSHPLPGFEDLAVAGDYAYVATGDDGLRIIDISNPAVPTEAGSYETPGPAWNVVVVGNMAYVAAGDGLHILNLSNPTTPTPTGFYPTPDSVLDVAVVGNIAYLAEVYSEDKGARERGGLRIVDLSDPAQPGEIGFYPMNPSQADEFQRPHAPRGARAVAVMGDYAYLTYRTVKQGGLRVVDISDPARPSQVGDYRDYVYFVSDVAVVEPPSSPGQIRAYVATSVNFGLLVLNLSNPAQPVVVTDDVPGAARGLAIMENTLYVADEFGGLHIADISNPARAFQIGLYDTLGDARQVVVGGNRAYVADGLDKLWVMDLSDPASPVELGSFTVPGNIQAIAVAEDTIYIAAETAGLQVVNVSDPTQPTQAGSYATPGLAYDVAVAGDYLYVADGQLHALNISDSATLSPAGVYKSLEQVRNMLIAGKLAYLPSSGLDLLDLSDPTQPVEIGFYDAPGTISDLAVLGDHVYAMILGSFYVVNVSDPTRPVEVSFYGLPQDARHMTVAQHPAAGSGQVYAYIAGESRLYALDLSDPAAPKKTLSYTALESVNDVAVAGDYVYIADGSGGLITLQFSLSISPAASDN